MINTKRLAGFPVAFALCLGAAGVFLANAAVAQDGRPTSLRGNLGLESLNPPPAVEKQDVPANRVFGRAYPQQPPLIPHVIDGYKLTKDFNQCLTCHEQPANAKMGAPKVSETHYSDREGKRLDKVSSARYFCTQCHVPQDDAKPLVNNTFRNATEVK